MSGSNRKESSPCTRTGLRLLWSRRSISTAATIRDSREDQATPSTPPVETEHEDGVAHDVLAVHPGGHQHGGPGVAHGPQQGDKGVGEGGDDEVGDSPLHHRWLHLAEEQAQQGPVEEQHQGHHGQGRGGNNVHQLIGGPVGPVQVLGPDGLGAHHRAAGGEGGENIEDQHVDQIHQGHAGHRSLPGGGDHGDVRHAYHDGEKLFDDQGQDKPAQGILAEHGETTAPSFGFGG